MALFHSNATNKVDSMGRISVPAAIRAALPDDNNQGVILFPSFKNPCIQGGDLGFLERMMGNIEQDFGVYSDEYEDMVHFTLGPSQSAPFDSKSRIKLPKALMDEVGITGDAVIVGVGGWFEIWDPGTYKAFIAERKPRALQSARKLRPFQSAKPTPPTTGSS